MTVKGMGRPCCLCGDATRLVRDPTPMIRRVGSLSVECAVLRLKEVCDLCDNDALHTLAKAQIQEDLLRARLCDFIGCEMPTDGKPYCANHRNAWMSR